MEKKKEKGNFVSKKGEIISRLSSRVHDKELLKSSYVGMALDQEKIGKRSIKRISTFDMKRGLIFFC